MTVGIGLAPVPAISYLHGLDLVAQSDGAATEYFLYDGLGSVRQVADETGSPLLTQTFDPYGSLYARVGEEVTRFGFTGEYGDGNGLLYLRARYYASSQGRFFQLDPLHGVMTYPQSLNPYMYAVGNPVLHTDPSGEIIPILIGGIVIGVVTAVSWDVFVQQGKGGIDNIQNVFDPSHYCNVNWAQTALYGGVGAVIGTTVAGAYAAGAYAVAHIPTIMGHALGQAAAWQVGATELAWSTTEATMFGQGLLGKAVWGYLAFDTVDDALTYIAAIAGNPAAQEQLLLMVTMGPLDGPNTAMAFFGGGSQLINRVISADGSLTDEASIIAQIRSRGGLQRAGDRVIGAYTSNGRVAVWLEEGNIKAGWRHIYQQRNVAQSGGHFREPFGLTTEAEIQEFILRYADQVYTPGVEFSGKVEVAESTKFHLHLEIGDNGFIVTAYPEEK